MRKKIAIFGCKNTTKFLIKSLVKKVKIDYLITIDEKKGDKFAVADYCDLDSVAEENSIKVYKSNTYSLKNKDDINYIKKLKIDIAFVIGWQRIIPGEILDSMAIGSFGMHGSSMDLPLGRGRSPMNWSLIEGRDIFFTNLFRYDSGVDSGDILDTFRFDILDKDTSETLHFKNTLAMKFLIEKNIDSLLGKDFHLKKQKNISPTYYPKRTPDDSLIDWNSNINDLDRFIRAVTKPFNGAFTFFNNQKIIIYTSQIFDSSYFGFQNHKNGEVVIIFPNDKFLVKCNGGLLLVTDFHNEGPNLNIGDILNNSDKKINIFKKNKDGYHDLEK
ncbi:MAG: formyltransferase family protein [Candidatus Neomarinimicrobiota bacterium]|nr:formyltransferase family protein [Candidatus Neomarinimicrobiota bacterium]